MLEKVYDSANKKIHIKPEFLEDTENKIIRQLNSTSHKRNLIYRYRFDGQLILDDGWIYYIEHNPEKQIFVGKLYKMRTDGSEKQLVIDNLVERININKDYIFYSNVDDDSR